jgi:hypothetical protein
MKAILLNIFIGVCIFSVIGNAVIAGVNLWNGESGEAALRIIFVFSGCLFYFLESL